MRDIFGRRCRRNRRGLFDQLSYRRRRALAELVEQRHVEAGRTLLVEGDPGDIFIFLLHGEVSVLVDGEHRHCSSGDFFGELALLPRISGSSFRQATIVATTECTLGVCDRDNFDELIARFPRIGGQILAQAYTLTDRTD